MGKQTLCCGGMELSFDVRSVTDSPDIWICVAFFCYDVKVLVSEKARDNHMCQLRFAANQARLRTFVSYHVSQENQSTG